MDALYERVHPDDRSRLQLELATALTTPASAGFDTEFRPLSRDGRTAQLHLRAHVDVEGPAEAGRAVRLLGTTRNVTATRAAEHAPREQAHLLQQIEEMAHIGGCDFDPATGLGHWTAETLRIHGVTDEPEMASSGLDRFRVYLPSAAAPAHAGTTPGRLDDGHETILLVDDEEAVRRVTSRTLSRRGYTVLEASSPHAALACADGHVTVDLLLTDVVMPEMSGPALALALRAQQPALKVLFMSGYVDDAMATAGVEQIPHALLVKPFSARELAERVRQTLDATEPL